MKPLISLPKGTPLLYTLCLHLAVGASIWGYNIGILSSILVHPGFRSALHDPSPSQKGLITGLYYLGTLLSYVCSRTLWRMSSGGDGRRWWGRGC